MLEGRRGFLGLLGVALAGVGFRTAAAVAAPETERDPRGRAVAQAFRLMPDGCFGKVPRSALRPGDRFVLLGLDGDRLWRAEAFVVGSRGRWVAPDGTEHVHFVKRSRDFLAWFRSMKPDDSARAAASIGVKRGKG
jgi:hypothetical protein